MPRRGDSNEYTGRTIILWKIEKAPLNYPHLPSDLRYNELSAPRTTHV